MENIATVAIDAPTRHAHAAQAANAELARRRAALFNTWQQGGVLRELIPHPSTIAHLIDPQLADLESAAAQA